MTAQQAAGAVARGLLVAVMLLGFAGVVLAYRADATTDPYTLTRDGVELASPLEDNGHLNVRTDAGATYNLHAESKCVERTDAECAGRRHEVAQYIGATFIPWSVIGVPADACVTWVQRSGTTYHYGEHGEPPFCLTEEEPCPTPTTEPSPEPTSPGPSPTPTPTSDPSPTPSASEPPATPQPEPSPTEPSGQPTSSPSPTTAPSPEPSAPTTTSPSAPPASTVPTPTSAEPTTSAVSAVAPDTATPPTATTAPDLAATGLNLAPWWIGIGALALIVTGILLHLIRPSKGDE